MECWRRYLVCRLLATAAVAHAFIQVQTVGMRQVLGALLDRLGLYLLILLAASLTTKSTAFAEEEKLYHFIDENGVPHLSNTPSDPRYKPLAPAKRGNEADSSSHAGDYARPEQLVRPAPEAPSQSSSQPDTELPAVQESAPDPARTR